MRQDLPLNLPDLTPAEQKRIIAMLQHRMRETPSPEGPQAGEYTMTYFATKNRRSPLVAMYGDYPRDRAVRKGWTQQRSFFHRPSIQDEDELAANSPRHLAVSWDDPVGLLIDEAQALPATWLKPLLMAMIKADLLPDWLVSDFGSLRSKAQSLS